MMCANRETQRKTHIGQPKCQGMDEFILYYSLPKPSHATTDDMSV